MEEWKEFKLSDLTIMKNGKKRPSCIGQYPVYGGNGIMDYADVFNAENTIVVGRVGAYCGNVYYCSKKCWVSDNAIAVFANDLVDVKYLFYLMSSLDLNHQHIGGAQPLMTQDIIGGFKVFIPSLNIQEKIASFLSSLDDKIELNRRINENLEQQAQALFKSWFVDFEPFKDGKFVDSELGMIPEGWKVGYYTELVDIKGGGTPKTSIKEYWNGDIPFFSPKDITSSCFVLDTEKHITAMGLDNCNSNLFPSKTVFITARGTVGKIVMAGTEMAMNQTNYALLGKHNVSQYYVYLITLQLVTRLLKKANGAVFNAITTRDFTSERIVIPFYSIIKSFSSIVEPLYENILLNEFQIKRLSKLRDTLLPRLMSGELQI